MVGCDNYQGIAGFGHCDGCGHRSIKRQGFCQGAIGIAAMTGMINAAAFNHQNISVICL